ncbi:MAG: hypothetical protein K2J10_04820 [Muribaculaceae bacterium]|nr:hypothetical protein [Muribaculaceae bacterium]
MKKAIAALLFCSAAMSASALLDGDGYYRVQNAKTERYIYVLDDKGSLNFQATTAELGAIELWKNYDKTISDPATVIYVKDLNGKKQDYDLQTQGTGVYEIINYPVSIRLADKNLGTYSIFGRNSGLTRYIGDGTRSSKDQGYVTSLENGDYYRWYFHPITTDDSNYFGVAPEFEDNGEYYTTIYADFPFDFHSTGMTAYYVNTVAEGKAFLTEVTDAIPAGTPVIIKCSSNAAANNKLSIGGNPAAINDNLLKGVYFCNKDLVHKNLTPYDKKTMRVLGKLADGSIGFVTADITNLPRNKAYLVVPEGTPAELSITTETYSGIADITAENVSVRLNGMTLYVNGKAAEIYNITGSHVGHAADGAAFTLPAAGLYLVKAGKTVTKIIAK